MLKLCLVLFFSLLVVRFSDSAATGKLTFYGKGSDSGGKCMLNDPNADVAISLDKTVAIGGYTSSLCGICVQITPLGTGTGTSSFPTWKPFVAFVNNQCPECPATNLDLAETGDGIWDIQWTIVDCPVVGNIKLQLKTGSSVYWTEISARNFKVQLKSMEFFVGGAWKSLTRQDYNYFIYQSAVTPPVQTRLTSVNGETLYYTLTASDYQKIEPNLIDIGAQFSSSGSTVTLPSPTPITSPSPTPKTSPTPTSQTVPTPTQATGTCTTSTDCCYAYDSTNLYYMEVSFTNLPTGSVVVQCGDGSKVTCISTPWSKWQCYPTGTCTTPRKTIVQRSGYSECCTLKNNCASSAVLDTSAENSSNTLSGPAIAGISATVVILVGLVVIIIVFVRTRKHVETV